MPETSPVESRPLADSRCAAHPDRPAVFRCEACERLLCAECVREGHRLIFCGHCGERALALAAGASSNVQERKRAVKLERPYSFREALAYPFRGSGRLMIPAFMVLMVLSTIVPLLGPAAAFFAWVLLPGLLFEIVRTTAEGQIELPEWPDYSEPFERFREGIWLLLVGVTVLLPTVALFYLSGCDVVALFFPDPAEDAPICWGPRLAGAGIGSLLGVFALGATGAHSSGWLAIRIDLHLRALFTSAARDAMLVAGLAASLFIVSSILQHVLAPVPVLGTALGAALSSYALFAGAHLVGLVFRRHARVLDPIYRD